MRLETSFNMHIVTFVKLFNATQRTGIPMLGLIREMMYNYAKDHKNMYVARGTVKYQKRDMDNNWKVFRVSLNEKDYELFTDMRKVMKLSVSYLVALAIKKYLDKIVCKILKNNHRYAYLIHDALGERIGKLKNWIFSWYIIKRRKIPDY